MNEGDFDVKVLAALRSTAGAFPVRVVFARGAGPSMPVFVYNYRQLVQALKRYEEKE
jgi:hypothetical protein